MLSFSLSELIDPRCYLCLWGGRMLIVLLLWWGGQLVTSLLWKRQIAKKRPDKLTS